MATGSGPRFRENVNAMRITWYDDTGQNHGMPVCPCGTCASFGMDIFINFGFFVFFFCGFLMMQVALDRLQNNAKHNDVM